GQRGDGGGVQGEGGDGEDEEGADVALAAGPGEHVAVVDEVDARRDGHDQAADQHGPVPEELDELALGDGKHEDSFGWSGGERNVAEGAEDVIQTRGCGGQVGQLDAVDPGPVEQELQV